MSLTLVGPILQSMFPAKVENTWAWCFFHQLTGFPLGANGSACLYFLTLSSAWSCSDIGEPCLLGWEDVSPNKCGRALCTEHTHLLSPCFFSCGGGAWKNRCQLYLVFLLCSAPFLNTCSWKIASLISLYMCKHTVLLQCQNETRDIATCANPNKHFHTFTFLNV